MTFEVFKRVLTSIEILMTSRDRLRPLHRQFLNETAKALLESDEDESNDAILRCLRRARGLDPKIASELTARFGEAEKAG